MKSRNRQSTDSPRLRLPDALHDVVGRLEEENAHRAESHASLPAEVRGKRLKQDIRGFNRLASCRKTMLQIEGLDPSEASPQFRDHLAATWRPALRGYEASLADHLAPPADPHERPACARPGDSPIPSHSVSSPEQQVSPEDLAIAAELLNRLFAIRLFLGKFKPLPASSPQPDPTEPDPTEPNPTEPNLTEPGPAEPNLTEFDLNGPDPAAPDPSPSSPPSPRPDASSRHDDSLSVPCNSNVQSGTPFCLAPSTGSTPSTPSTGSIPSIPFRRTFPGLLFFGLALLNSNVQSFLVFLALLLRSFSESLGFVRTASRQSSAPPRPRPTLETRPAFTLSSPFALLQPFTPFASHPPDAQPSLQNITAVV